MLAGGCSSGGERVVFTVPTGFSQGITATTVDIVDMGVPPWGLHNLSDSTVKLRGVSLVSVPRALHLRSVTAYLYTDTNGDLGVGHGDLLKYCRRQDPPYPVRGVVTPPRSDSKWLLVIALTFSKPGTYNLAKAKVYYTINGQDGWQYENLNTSIVVKAAGSDTKPRLDGCL